MLHTIGFALLGLVSATGAAIAFRPRRPVLIGTLVAGQLVGCVAGWLTLWIFGPVSSVPSLAIALVLSAAGCWQVAARGASRAPQSISPVSVRGALPALTQLDGIRGVAILLVLIEHSWIPTWNYPNPSVVDKGLSFVYLGGWTGVDLFFVLSGYLITGILWESRGRSDYFKNFYFRRILRIFPLYYGVLFLYFMVGPHLPTPSDLGDAGREQAWYWTYLSNISMARHGQFAPSALGVSWSLAIEEQFYLVWPPVVLLLGRKRLIQLCVFLIGAAFVWRLALVRMNLNPQSIYVLLPTQMDGLAAGALIALLPQWQRLDSVLRRLVPAVGLAGLGVFVIIGVHAAASTYAFFEGDPLMQTIGYSSIVAAFACILIGSIASGPSSPALAILNSRVLRTLGKYSYGIYLLHRPVLSFLAITILPGLVAISQARLGAIAPGQIAYSLIFVGSSVAVAWVSWTYYERPFLYLKRFFGYVRSTDALRKAPEISLGATPVTTPVSVQPRD